eukprot:375929_1
MLRNRALTSNDSESDVAKFNEESSSSMEKPLLHHANYREMQCHRKLCHLFINFYGAIGWFIFWVMTSSMFLWVLSEHLRSIPYSAVYDITPLKDYQKEHAKWAKTYLTQKLFGNPRLFDSLKSFEFDSHSNSNTSLCIGVLTRDRGNLYPTRTVAALLQGLVYARTNAQHAQQFPDLPARANVTVLLCNVEDSPEKHTELAEFHNSLPFYQLKSKAQKSTDNAEKMHYSECGTECLRRSNADNVLLLEDDAVAARTFLPRLLSQIRALERRDPQWGLLKLFWSEVYMGWSADDVMWLIVAMVLGILTPTAITLFRRRNLKPAFAVLCYSALFCTVLLLSALLIGKQNLWPPVPRGDGAHDVRGYAGGTVSVSSVAITYRRELFEKLADSLRSPKSNSVDLEAWDFVESRGLVPYLMQPNIFQHIGVFSSLKGHHQGWKKLFHSFTFRDD